MPYTSNKSKVKKNIKKGMTPKEAYDKAYPDKKTKKK